MSLAVVAMAEGLAASRLFAARGGYRVDTEHELIGMGAANIGAGLSGGLGVAGSLSKTAASDQAGGHSQVTGIGGVVLFGPLPGLGIAIVTSLLAIIYRSSSPRMEVLGKIDSEKAAWGRMRDHTSRRTVPGVLEEVDQWPDTRALVLEAEEPND